MLNNRIAKNASWIIVCKALEAVLGLVITMLTARLYGPENYGAISYAASLTTFLTPVAQLGFTSTLVGEIIASPDKEGEILGSAIVSSILSGTFCIIGIWTYTRFALPDEPSTVAVCVLYSLSLLAQGAELIQYWFQAKLLSKYVAILTLVGYALMSIYQIVILLLKQNVELYALSKVLEYTFIAVGLLIVYKKKCTCRLKVSLECCKALLKRGRFYILSGLMVMMLGQTDRIMLMNMLGETEVGLYSAAVVCANLTEFVFLAIIDSFRPVILAARQENSEKYETMLARLYSIVVYLAIAQSVGITLLAKPIVWILYGTAYSGSVGILQMLVWYTAFSYFGSARMIWIYAEGQQAILCLTNFFGALANIGLNMLMIPKMGGTGAALASLITQCFTNLILGWIIPALRPNNATLMRSLCLKRIWRR